MSTSKQLGCSQCAWRTDREACQICKQGTGGSFKDIDAMIAEEPLQFRHNEPPSKEELKQAMEADATFQGFLCLRGEEHKHYIIGHVDEIEYTDSRYGNQN